MLQHESMSNVTAVSGGKQSPKFREQCHGPGLLEESAPQLKRGQLVLFTSPTTTLVVVTALPFFKLFKLEPRMGIDAGKIATLEQAPVLAGLQVHAHVVQCPASTRSNQSAVSSVARSTLSE